MIETVSDIDRLVEFEKESWPEALRATREQLAERVEAFPEGIFILSENGTDIAQVTVSPKAVLPLEYLTSFAHMRDLPVDRSSLNLWVTNLAVAEGFRGKGYGLEILDHAVSWAKESGYIRIAAGVTSFGTAEITFRSAAMSDHMRFRSIGSVAGYWPEDTESAGYGIPVEIVL